MDSILLKKVISVISKDPETNPGENIKPAQLTKLASKLSVKFPEEYEALLKKFGVAEFRFARMYSLGESEPVSIPNFIGEVNVSFPNRVPIADDYSGNHICLDYHSSAENPAVVLIGHDVDGVEFLASNFLEFICKPYMDKNGKLSGPARPKKVIFKIPGKVFLNDYGWNHFPELDSLSLAIRILNPLVTETADASDPYAQANIRRRIAFSVSNPNTQNGSDSSSNRGFNLSYPSCRVVSATGEDLNTVVSGSGGFPNPDSSTPFARVDYLEVSRDLRPDDTLEIFATVLP